MGNFLTSLGKSFVRSAVNQVGRDGGKVISNRVYGDKHATPIRGVSNHGTVKLEGRVISNDFSAEPWFSNQWWFYILMPLSISFGFWFLWIFFLWRGIELITRKNTIIKIPYNEPIYVNDRRYSSGTRIDGYRTNYNKIKVESPPEHRKRHMIKGVIYLIIGLVMMYAAYLFLRNFF